MFSVQSTEEGQERRDFELETVLRPQSRQSKFFLTFQVADTAMSRLSWYFKAPEKDEGSKGEAKYCVSASTQDRTR